MYCNVDQRSVSSTCVHVLKDRGEVMINYCIHNFGLLLTLSESLNLLNAVSSSLTPSDDSWKDRREQVSLGWLDIRLIAN